MYVYTCLFSLRFFLIAKTHKKSLCIYTICFVGENNIESFYINFLINFF
jgi:hypothetical protein